MDVVALCFLTTILSTVLIVCVRPVSLLTSNLIPFLPGFKTPYFM